MPVTLFTTAGCHLCELAYDLLLKVSADLSVEINPVEIGDDDDLVERYGVTIPVVQLDNGEELNWPFDEFELKQFISNKINI